MKRLIHSSLSLVSFALLFMTVACSHTKRTVSQLDELTPDVSDSAQVEKAADSTIEEVAPVAENTKEEAVKEEAVEEVAVATEGAKAPETVALNEAPVENSAEAKEADVESPVSSVADILAKVDNFKVEPAAPAPVAEKAPAPKEAPAAKANATAFLLDTEKSAINLKTVEKDLASAKRRVSKPKKGGASQPKVQTTTQMKVEEPAPVVAQAPKVEPKAEEAPKPDLASSDLSSLIEKNLLWVAFGIVGGIVAAFVTIRNRKKSDPLG